MSPNTTSKILIFDDLIAKVRDLQKQGKVVVQSHGVWDLIHPGNLRHLKGAKSQGDILVVTIIKDEHVRRGPGRPVFPDKFRAESVASLELVDYVSVVEDKVPFQCLEWLKPNVFAKGQTHSERDSEVDHAIFEEERFLKNDITRLYLTEGFSASSSNLTSRLLNLYPPETKHFLNEFAQRYNFQQVQEYIESLSDLKVLLIGDTIVDEYIYCDSLYKSSKSHIVVSKYLEGEVFAGGVLAVANHLAGILSKVTLVTLVGNDGFGRDFVSENLAGNVKAELFCDDSRTTVTKRRYVHQHHNQKLFEINYLDDSPLEQEIEEDIADHLSGILPDYDIVLVTDFGHGLMSRGLVELVHDKAKMCVVNTQTNGANQGYNHITKYNKPDYACLDEREARLAVRDKFSPIDEVLAKLMGDLGSRRLVITMGSLGSIAMDRGGQVVHTPIFSTNVVDTIGAGDALFSYVAPCLAREFPLDLVGFIGNTVGALAVQIMCNRSSVTKHDLYQLLHSLLSVKD